MESYKQKFEDLILKHPKVDAILTQLEEKTKVKKVYLGYGALAVVVAWLMFGFGAQLLCNGIGFLYPAYMSIKAVESVTKDDDKQWLIYWIVFACFSVVEFFSDLVCSWIPFYWLTKCVFLVWCMSPMNGAETIYRTLLLPWFKKNESHLDKLVGEGRQTLSTFANQASAEALQVAAKAQQLAEDKKSE